MGSDVANGLAAVTAVLAIGGTVLSVLLVIAVLRMWHHTAAMRTALEEIRAQVAPVRPVAPPAAAPRKPGAF